MRPSAFRGTLGRLEEGIFLNLLPNIMVGTDNSRWPPYFGYLMVLGLVFLVPSFIFSQNAAILLTSILATLACFALIPLATYLSLKNESYRIEGSTLIRENNFLNSHTEEADLRQIDKVYADTGLLIPKLLGIGKICLADQNGITQMQIDYTEDYEKLVKDIESTVNTV